MQFYQGLPILTNMVNNMSLQSAYIPATPKEAMIKPKLKKVNLNSVPAIHVAQRGHNWTAWTQLPSLRRRHSAISLI